MWKLDRPAVPFLKFDWSIAGRGLAIVEPTPTLILLISNLRGPLLFSQTILNPFLLRTPFLQVFTARSVNEIHVMCCFVIVQLNSG